MALTSQHVEHIARLARIGISPGEMEILRDQLSDILARFEVLSEVDTESTETTAHPAGSVALLRSDSAADSQSRDQTLANAPNRQGDFVRVRAVLG